MNSIQTTRQVVYEFMEDSCKPASGWPWRSARTDREIQRQAWSCAYTMRPCQGMIESRRYTMPQQVS